MGQFHFHPDEYLDLMRSELPDYFARKFAEMGWR